MPSDPHELLERQLDRLAAAAEGLGQEVGRVRTRVAVLEDWRKSHAEPALQAVPSKDKLAKVETSIGSAERELHELLGRVKALETDVDHLEERSVERPQPAEVQRDPPDDPVAQRLRAARELLPWVLVALGGGGAGYSARETGLLRWLASLVGG